MLLRTGEVFNAVSVTVTLLANNVWRIMACILLDTKCCQ